MTRKRLSLQFVSKELRKCYDSEKKRIDITLPRLQFLSKSVLYLSYFLYFRVGDC